MFKIISSIAISALLLLSVSKSSTAQNVDIQSVSISSGASTCTNDTATLSILLGCINFNYDSISANVSNDTLNINLYYTGGSICYGALSYPSHSVEIPATSYGTYTVIAKAYQSFTLADTYNMTTNFAACEPVSEFEMSDSSICLGDSLWMTNLSQSSNFYTWLINGQFVSNDSNESHLFGSSGQSTITLIVTDGNTIDSSTQTVDVLNTAPAINIGTDTMVCPNDSLLLDAGSGYSSYAWSTGDSTQSIERAIGLFSVTVTEDGSCDGSDTINLTQIYVQDLVAIQKGESACTNLEIGTSNSFTSYSWSTGSIDSSITVQVSGTYTVTATSPEGCERVDEIIVDVLESPENDFGNDTTMCSDISWNLSLSAASSGTYLWQDSSSSGFFIVVNSPGIYWLSITADNGCTSLDSIVIDEKKCTVGIADQGTDEFLVYPNPASDNAQVVGFTGTGIMMILDRAGRVVLAEQKISNNTAQLDLQNISDGVYFIEIKTDSFYRVERLVIAR